MLEFLDLDYDLQAKYNGTISSLKVIQHPSTVIYRYLVPKRSGGFSDAVIIDVGETITQEELSYVASLEDINTAGLFLFAQHYGLDIYNKDIPNRKLEDFQYTCTKIASYLAVQKSKVATVIFCNTLFPTYIDLRVQEKEEEKENLNPNGVQMITINKGNKVTRF